MVPEVRGHSARGQLEGGVDMAKVNGGIPEHPGVQITWTRWR